MSGFKELKQKRTVVKSQLTRLLSYFESPVAKIITDIQVRQERLRELWDNFDRIQTKIDEISFEKDAELARHLEDGEIQRKEFEDSYYTVAGMAKRLIDEYQLAQQRSTINLASDEGDQLRSGRNYEVPRNRPKLPEIKLPEFNGEYTKWTLYKDSFESTIHNETDLTPMQKHQYLVSVLRGEALRVIQGYKISNDNYQEAWKLFKDTYDNKVIIIETHIDELLQFPTISKDDKADSLRKFSWHIRTHLSSLKSLGQPVDHWDTMIIHLAKKKLDFIEQRDWQDVIKECTIEQLPKMETFLKFLMDRSSMLRVLAQGKEKQSP